MLVPAVPASLMRAMVSGVPEIIGNPDDAGEARMCARRRHAGRAKNRRIDVAEDRGMTQYPLDRYRIGNGAKR